MIRMNLHVSPADISRVEAIVGHKGASKFVRNAISQQFDRLAPGEEKAGPPCFESDGGQEQRLSGSGRATVFSILRQKKASLDQMQQALGIADPIDFIYVLLGHRSLPDQVTSVIVTEILGKLSQQIDRRGRASLKASMTRSPLANPPTKSVSRIAFSPE